MESCYMKNPNGIKLCKRPKISSGLTKCSIHNCSSLQVHSAVSLNNNKNQNFEIYKHKKKSRGNALKLPSLRPTIGGGRTTCIVVTIPGCSQICIDLASESVVLFSSILPPLMSLISFIIFGPFSLSIPKRKKKIST